MNRRHGGRRALCLAVLAAALCSAAVDTAFCGDAVVARTLLESGKKALNAKKYDDALPLFRKAFAEDPTLVEAVYWRAQVHEKMKDDAAALADYREFLGAYAKKAGPSADDQKLKALADKRVEVLAVSDTEFRKLEEKYVADLLALAKSKIASDPGAALAAANRILDIVPKHAEALALRDRLGEKRTEDPYDGVATWRNYVKEQAFRSDVVKYANDMMTVEIKAGGKLRSEPATTMAADYAGEMEFRVAEVFEPTWSVGFAMGETRDGYFAALLAKAEIRVVFGKPKQRPDLVASFATKPADPAAWRRLGFTVHGFKIQVYVDGEKVIDEVQAKRPDFSGDLGITVTGCRAEFRSVRSGSFK